MRLIEILILAALVVIITVGIVGARNPCQTSGFGPDINNSCRAM